MKRAINIIIATVMWCVIVAYFIFAGAYSRERRATVRVEKVHIEVVDSAANPLVNSDSIARWLAAANLAPIGGQIDSVDRRKIEQVLAARNEIRRADVWSALAGVMTIRVEARVPIMRVETANGYRFWFTEDGYILPDREGFGPEVELVTGVCDFPFSPSATGSYADIERTNHNDFLARFTAIDTERNNLEQRHSAIRAEMQKERAKNPKRLWGEARKERFLEDKAARIDALEKQGENILLALENLAEKKRATEQKEFFSHQSHRLLPKLANFVKYIRAGDFWTARILRTEVAENARDETKLIAGQSRKSWQEPEIRLVPRGEGAGEGAGGSEGDNEGGNGGGGYVILLGELDGGEEERMEKLRTFLLSGQHEGFDVIDARYEKQIVCTKKPEEGDNLEI